jgi:hypothetical protein
MYTKKRSYSINGPDIPGSWARIFRQVESSESMGDTGAETGLTTGDALSEIHESQFSAVRSQAQGSMKLLMGSNWRGTHTNPKIAGVGVVMSQTFYRDRHV